MPEPLLVVESLDAWYGTGRALEEWLHDLSVASTIDAD